MAKLYTKMNNKKQADIEYKKVVTLFEQLQDEKGKTQANQANTGVNLSDIPRKISNVDERSMLYQEKQQQIEDQELKNDSNSFILEELPKKEKPTTLKPSNTTLSHKRTISKLNLEESSTTSVNSVKSNPPTNPSSASPLEISSPTTPITQNKPFPANPNLEKSHHNNIPPSVSPVPTLGFKKKKLTKNTTLSKFSSFFGINKKKPTLNSNDVPILVHDCCLYIQQYGLEKEGIFRVAGNFSQVKLLRRAYDKGNSFFFVQILIFFFDNC